MAFYISLVFTVLWFLVMTYLTHQDGEHTGKTSRELAEKLSRLDLPDFPDFLGFLDFIHSHDFHDFHDSDMNILNSRLRRLAHVVVYAVLTILLGITLELGGYPLWPAVGVVVWAWADEATKPLVRGRHFSWFDVGLNVLGIAIGMVGMAVVIFVF